MDGVGNQSSHHKGGSGAHTLLEAAAPGEGKVKCIVPGCTVDLSTLDAYCRKANTCHEHQKAKVLDVKGRASRFCQQCVRIHDLARFDGDKRGCRKRLAQHNLRRKRKVAVKKLTKDLACQDGSTASLPASMLSGEFSSNSGASEPGFASPADSFVSAPGGSTYSCSADVIVARKKPRSDPKPSVSAGNHPLRRSYGNNKASHATPAEASPVPKVIPPELQKADVAERGRDVATAVRKRAVSRVGQDVPSGQQPSAPASSPASGKQQSLPTRKLQPASPRDMPPDPQPLSSAGPLHSQMNQTAGSSEHQENPSLDHELAPISMDNMFSSSCGPPSMPSPAGLVSSNRSQGTTTTNYWDEPPLPSLLPELPMHSGEDILPKPMAGQQSFLQRPANQWGAVPAASILPNNNCVAGCQPDFMQDMDFGLASVGPNLHLGDCLYMNDCTLPARNRMSVGRPQQPQNWMSAEMDFMDPLPGLAPVRAELGLQMMSAAGYGVGMANGRAMSQGNPDFRVQTRQRHGILPSRRSSRDSVWRSGNRDCFQFADQMRPNNTTRVDNMGVTSAPLGSDLMQDTSFGNGVDFPGM
eukprot:CAMPEP_0117669392 /NCGR_PEP_ID=MMETSP0804-20121206/12108_1 /TAXON_ID=1074897 /ORGANISM="Tetraselmis astigmatica, Strain CCMP880" /LENGTH=583 /DNA_ID=CAMNT_0005477447 /DNA_START=480 /DNA_END=2231 /DNA_ORIENTATION=+